MTRQTDVDLANNSSPYKTSNVPLDYDAGAFLSKKLNGREYVDANGQPRGGRNHLESALKHNLRELSAERGPYGNIDPIKTPYNYILRGPSTSMHAMVHADNIVSSADTGGKKLRKDTVWGIELIFTALPKTNGNLLLYFEDCTNWAENEFKVPVLSSVVHLDQGAPHCHVLLIPISNGKMNGGRIYGNKATMVARLSSFYECVGKRYGLNRPEPKTTRKQPYAVRMGMLQRLTDFLSEGPKLTGMQIEALLKPFRTHPQPLAKIFGVEWGGRRSQLKFGC
jgi:hypothetical protein